MYALVYMSSIRYRRGSLLSIDPIDREVKVGMTWETHMVIGDGLGWAGDRWDSYGIKIPNPSDFVCLPRTL